MIIDNNFYMDDIAGRIWRFIPLQSNIDSLAAEIGVEGDLLEWGRHCGDEWQEIVHITNSEQADKFVGFSKYQKGFKSSKDYYQKVKKLLKAKIAGHGNAEEIRRAYSISGQTPRTRDGLESAIDDMLRQNERYVDAGKPWVLPDRFIDELRALRTAMSELHTSACAEREEASAAIVARNERFKADTRRLRLIFEHAAATWGVEHSNFIVLGMLPKSMVWTKKRPPSPENFRYDASAKTFQWDFIDGADSYEAHYREAGEGGHWTAFYEGKANSCPPPEGLSGAYDFRVRAIANGKEGHWSGSIEKSIQN